MALHLARLPSRVDSRFCKPARSHFFSFPALHNLQSLVLWLVAEAR
jgi:hypothetical protein